jgi:LuxR family maltose regulon positive regulatory protein
MSVSLSFPHINTKLHIPTTRSDLVARPHLNRQLDRCVEYKLLLVSAPAGFGKTTLLGEWSQQSAWPIAWVSLDTGDNDPMRFWSYVVAALDKLETNVGANVLPMIQSPQPASIEFIIPTLINTVVNVPDHFALVLDDYHCIESETIHTALAYLLDYLPSNMHLIVATRTDPPWPLAQWRARGQLMELRTSELRFSRTETERLLNQVTKLNLATEDVIGLQERTEGWVAGLQLAALAARELSQHAALGPLQGFRGDHQFVVDYLAAEVLQQQPGQIRDFLLQTAILDTLSGSLCDATTGQANGQAVLEQLHHQNLFITALNRRGQYRYHQLFADFLRDQLRRDPSHDPQTLHLRAADWYERHGDLDHAINHALAAGHTAEAVQLIEETARTHMMRGEFATLLDWFKDLPDQVICSRPQFCLIYAWVLANLGQLDAAARYLDQLEVDVEANDEARVLLGEAARVRARIAVIHGDTAQNVHYSKKALDLLPVDAPVRGDVFLDLAFAHGSLHDFEAAEAAFIQAIDLSQVAGNSRGTLMATYYLADLYRGHGQLRQAAQRCQQGLVWNQQIDPPPTAACWAHAGFGALLYEWNDLTTALDHLQKAVNLAQQSGEVKVLLYAPVSLAHTLQALGQPDEALATLDAATRVAQQTCVQDLVDLADVARAKVWIRQGEMNAVARWLQRRGLGLRNDALSPTEVNLLAWFHVIQNQAAPSSSHNDLARIVELLDAEYEADAALNRTYPLVEHLSLLALAHRGLGDDDRAMAKVAEAVSLAEPMELVRTFVDCGAGMVGLLRELAARERGSSYVAKLLAAFRDDAVPQRTMDSPPLPASQPLIEPLRQREIEVLHYIAQGRSNKEIADEMVVAVSTVKWYLRNIYDKLQVHRRTQALARARELNLI